MFGYTGAQVSGFGMTFLLDDFMRYMLFIIGKLAYKAKAGFQGSSDAYLLLVQVATIVESAHPMRPVHHHDGDE